MRWSLTVAIPSDPLQLMSFAGHDATTGRQVGACLARHTRDTTPHSSLEDRERLGPCWVLHAALPHGVRTPVQFNRQLLTWDRPAPAAEHERPVLSVSGYQCVPDSNWRSKRRTHFPLAGYVMSL